MNIVELQKSLEKLPNDIYLAEKKVLEAKNTLELKKIDYNVSFSTALLATDASNATEKKAQAEISTLNIRKELLKVEQEYLRHQAYLQALNNKFIAVRKISSIEERLMQAQVSGN